MVSIPGDTVIQIKSILPGSAGVNWMHLEKQAILSYSFLTRKRG
jgi:hypothetical protein